MKIEMLGSYAGYKRGEGDTLVVLFSHRDTPAGKFSQVKVVGKEVRHPVLFLNCPQGGWYCEGVPHFGTDPESTAAGVRAWAAERGFSRLLCMGFSMGGYGSLLHGCLMDADLILSFSPEVVLNFADNRSLEQREGKRSEHDSLLDLMAARTRPTRVYVGTDDMCDVLQASLIVERTPAIVHSLPGAPHGTLAHLAELGLLAPLVTELIETGMATTTAHLEGPVPPAVLGQYRPPEPLGDDATLAGYKSIYMATRLPAQAYYIGRRHLKREEWADAADWLRRAVEGDPANFTYRDLLRRTNRRLEKGAAAEPAKAAG